MQPFERWWNWISCHKKNTWNRKWLDSRQFHFTDWFADCGWKLTVLQLTKDKKFRASLRSKRYRILVSPLKNTKFRKRYWHPCKESNVLFNQTIFCWEDYLLELIGPPRNLNSLFEGDKGAYGEDLDRHPYETERLRHVIEGARSPGWLRCRLRHPC